MAAPSGIAAQLGLADETTVGTYAAPTRYLEFVSESLKLNIERMESRGLRAGHRVLNSNQWAPGRRWVDGDIEMEVPNVGLGLVLLQMFGGTATTAQPDAGNSPTVYTHTFSPGSLTGQSLTLQVGRPDVSGTVQPFSYVGMKVTEWELSAAAGELAALNLSFTGMDEKTSEALGTASYDSDLVPLAFTRGTLTVAGSQFDVKSFSLAGDNALAGDRFFLRGSNSNLPKEALENGQRSYTGELVADFDGLTAYQRFVNGTEASLVILLEGGVIEDTLRYHLKVTCNVRFDGNTPAVGGPEMLELSLPFKCVASDPDDDSTAIEVEYQTSDATP